MPLARQMTIDPRKTEGPWLQNDDYKWKMVHLSFGMFLTAGLTANFDLTGFPAGCLITGAFIRNRQNWTGGAIATATLSVGSTGSPAIYVAATNVFSGAPATLVGITQAPGTFVNSANPLAAGTIRIQLVTTVGNTNALLTGSADVFISLGGAKLYFGG